MATTDEIETILKADEDALKAKRARLRTLQKSVASLRTAAAEAQEAAAACLTASDGLSKRDLSQALDLTTAERGLILRPVAPVLKSPPKESHDGDHEKTAQAHEESDNPRGEHDDPLDRGRDKPHGGPDTEHY